MKSGMRVAMGLAVGYFLGRTRKGRLALMIGAGAMTGGLGGAPGRVVKQGTKLLGSTDAMGKIAPEIGQVTEMVKGELLDAAKSAAVATVTSRIDHLSDQLHDRAEGMRQAGAGAAQAGAGAAKQGTGAVADGRRRAGRAAGKPRREEPGDGGAEDEGYREDEDYREEDYPEDEAGGEEPDQDEEEDEEAGEPVGYQDEEDEEESGGGDGQAPRPRSGARGRAPAGRASGRQAPARRTRR